MSDRDFGQRVMAAAGVPATSALVMKSSAMGPTVTATPVAYTYPDPLTTKGFVALWDALEALGWRVEFRTLSDGTLVQVYKADEMGRPDLASIFQGGHENRAAALLEAAAQALGVKP